MLPKLLIACFLLDSIQTELLLRNLQSRNLDKCIAGVKEVKATPKEITDPAVSDALVKLLQRESSDPQWEARAEFTQYADYYDDLLALVQTIAMSTNRSDSWTALAESNYNDDSQFAKWLARQPNAFPILIGLVFTENPSLKEGLKTSGLPQAGEIVCGNITFVLAESCELTGTHCDQVLALLRARLTDRSAWTKLAAVRGLGICGIVSDIKLLKQMEPDYAGDKSWLHFLRASQEQIRTRM